MSGYVREKKRICEGKKKNEGDEEQYCRKKTKKRKTKNTKKREDR